MNFKLGNPSSPAFTAGNECIHNYTNTEIYCKIHELGYDCSFKYG